MKLFCLAVNGAGSGHRSFGVWSPAPFEDFGRGGDNRLAVGSDSGDGSVRRSTVACVGDNRLAVGSDSGFTAKENLQMTSMDGMVVDYAAEARRLDRMVVGKLSGGVVTALVRDHPSEIGTGVERGDQ
ncbi:hypothetical protein LWI29_034434 [Acer saccharum]|uniref:Uncharacterized protein n=1 Tax=Acer saccharum TaxID=4024 RepID=A0AA39REW6_ACESA|nr:hypothetical protein LWI29_034434 [Acer saccharum]